jgi:hypothetical protein
MLLKFFFCCSDSNLKENKSITFEKLNSNEEISNHNEIVAPSLNMNCSQHNSEILNISQDKKNNNEINNDKNNKHNNSINYNINNVNHLVNNINHINVINNSNYYSRERSNKLQNNKGPHINTIISNKSSFKSLLIKNYNSQNNLNIINTNKFKSNNNVNNFQSNNNNNNYNYQKANSNLSFSNLIVTKNTKSHVNDDTEILSPYELQLSGDIFFNKEIKIDRLGIKSNKIGDKRIRKEHLIKFGILINEKHRDSDFNTSDIKCKVEKESDPNKIDSLSSSFQIRGKEHNLDSVLNIEPDKVIKLLDKYEHIIATENKDEEDFSSPNIRKENKSITLFI